MDNFIIVINLVLNIAATAMLAFTIYWLIKLFNVTKNMETTAPRIDSDNLVKSLAEKLDAGSTRQEHASQELEAASAVTHSEFKRIAALIDRLESSVAAAGATSLRTERMAGVAQADRADVATDLAVAKLVIEDVALDLAESKIVIAGVAYDLKKAHERAQAVQGAVPGTAADAQAVQKPKPKRKRAT